jgi:hypothetical protein
MAPSAIVVLTVAMRLLRVPAAYLIALHFVRGLDSVTLRLPSSSSFDLSGTRSFDSALTRLRDSFGTVCAVRRELKDFEVLEVGPNSVPLYLLVSIRIYEDETKLAPSAGKAKTRQESPWISSRFGGAQARKSRRDAGLLTIDVLAEFPNLRVLDVALHLPAPDVAQGLAAMRNRNP